MKNKNIIASGLSESFLVFLISVIYFIDIIDFMMVMPLGPSFDKELGILPDYIGTISASYTLAAALVGFFASKILDRFDRKSLLVISLAGLALSNIMGGTSNGYYMLLISRMLAGVFGGIATSISFAVITDLIEAKKRGAAMGKVWGAFSVASVFGVPFGLVIANNFGWRMPFFVITVMSVIVMILIQIKLPSLKGHISEKNLHGVSIRQLFAKKNYILAYIISSLGMMGAFMIIPYIATYLRYNLNVSADQGIDGVALIYLIGGIASFIAMRIAGNLVDKYGSVFATNVGIFFVIFSLYFGYINIDSFLPTTIVFACFMVGMSMRNVANSTVSSKVPSGHNRAGFMSIISGLSHLFSSVGAGLSAWMLTYSQTTNKLVGMENVAIVSALLFLAVIPFLYMLERNLAGEEKESS